MPGQLRKHSLILAAFLFLYLPFLIKFGWRIRNKEAMDFSSYYAASITTFSQHVSPYSPQILQDAMGENVRVWPYLYSPPSLLLFAPLAMSSYQNSKLAFLILNHLLLFFLFWFIPRYPLIPMKKGDSNFYFELVTFAFLISFGPVAWTLQLGQVNILLLFFLTLFWFFSKREKYALAGIALALSIFLKSYPLLLIAPLLITKKYKEVFYTFFFLALISLLSVLILPESTWSDWIHKVVPGGGYLTTPEGLFHPGAEWNQSINGFFSKLQLLGTWPLSLNDKLIKQWAYLSSGILLIVLLIVSYCIHRFHCNSLDRILVVALPTIFLVAPFSWDHHMVYLVPSMLLVVTCQFERIKYFAGILLWSFAIILILILGAENIPQLKFMVVVMFWLVSTYLALTKKSSFLSDTNIRLEKKI